MRKLLVILGVPIDDLNMNEALDRLEDFVVIGRETGKSHQVATVNADFVVKDSDILIMMGDHKQMDKINKL